MGHLIFCPNFLLNIIDFFDVEKNCQFEKTLSYILNVSGVIHKF
jgi:hypothetical protein